MKKIIRSLTLKVTAITAIFSMAAALPQAYSATVTVLVGNGGLVYVPATTNINVNDTVNWSWSGNFHSTTSGSLIWDSGVHNVPFSFSRQFTSSGSFPYHCSIHGLPMSGTIIVASANTPPSVTITNPLSGMVFSAPASIKLQANASDSDGTVANVQFLSGTTVLTNLASAPYAFTNAGLAAGTYAFSAIATDNGGLSATNTINVSVVNPAAVTLGSPIRLSASNFRFTYAANVGLSYVVERTTNLSSPTWVSISTNVAATTSVLFTDSSATNSPGYYRVGRLPNP